MKYAITGSIGSGKTMVSEYIRSKSYHVFDCDACNKQLLENDKCTFNLIKDVFPSCIVDGEINKKVLSSIVFNNKEAKKKLENIMHPMILNKMNEEVSLYHPFFAEVPLLFETNWDKYFDYCLLIVVDREIALDRLTLRGLDKQESLRRLNNQMSVDEKMARSDGIIYNNCDLQSLYRQVDIWLKDNVGE